MKGRHWVLAPLAAGLLPGCTSLYRGERAPVVDNVELTAPVVLPAGETRVHFQGGEPRRSRDVVVWEPSCALVFVPASDEARRILPAQWQVTRTWRTYDAGSWQRGVSVYGIEMRLQGRNPAPERLVCEVWRTPEQLQRVLGKDEIEQAVGDWLWFRWRVR